MTLRAIVLESPSGVLLEKRLVAIYEFLHLVAGVMIRAPMDRDLEAPWIETLIDSAHPVWPDEDVIAISDLWR